MRKKLCSAKSTVDYSPLQMELLSVIAKGLVETPLEIVNHMVAKLFENHRPKPTDTVLDAGCGAGEFIQGIIEWCRQNSNPLPKILGIELDKALVCIARERFRDYPKISIEERDFLVSSHGRCEFVIGNPPYVSILQLSKEEKELYKPLFKTAKGRFDLYLLFFEKSLESLRENGQLIFITPEKYMYVETAEPLRRILAEMWVREIELLDENTFDGLITYPAITIVENSRSARVHETVITYRDGTKKNVFLPKHGEKWLPTLNGSTTTLMSHQLEDVCIRISCGVATGADEVFVRRIDSEPRLMKFAYPTISGRDLTGQRGSLVSDYLMLVPYDMNSELIPFEELGDLKEYLSQPSITERLKKRTCCAKKPWYAFHETPPMRDLFCPKILCKDLASEPDFWLDRQGRFIPRHSVYYIVPKDATMMDKLWLYLKSDFAKSWLMKNCQRAANNFIRLQSNILKKLPIPDELYSP